MDTWRSVIEREGMSGWSAALMSMRFAPGQIDEALYEWVPRLQKQRSPHTLIGIADLIRT
jgi:hypothetical protein